MEDDIKKNYDSVAETFDQDFSDVYADSRNICVRHIIENTHTTHFDQVLDLAVGTGNALRDLQTHSSIQQCRGVDISENMLETAKKKLGPGFQAICDTAQNIDQLFPPNSQDLILCHFVFSFTGRSSILEKSYKILKPGGFLSIATTTKQNLKQFYTGPLRIVPKFFPIYHYIRQADTPLNHNSNIERVQRYGFQVVRAERYQSPLTFQKTFDIVEWGYDSGWIIPYFARWKWAKIAAGWLLIQGARPFFNPPLFPMIATHDISLLLVQKPPL